MSVKCRTENIVYKCVASVHEYPNKVYSGTAEGDFKLTLMSFLLSNYKFNDQTFWKMSHQKYIMTFQLLSKQQHNFGN